MRLLRAITFAAGACAAAAVLQGCYTKSDFDDFYDRTGKCEGIDAGKLFASSDEVEEACISNDLKPSQLQFEDTRSVAAITRLAPNEMTGGSVIVRVKGIANPDGTSGALVSVIASARDPLTVTANVSSAVIVKLACDASSGKVFLADAEEAFPALTGVQRGSGNFFPVAAIESVSASSKNGVTLLDVQGRLTLYRNTRKTTVGGVRLSAVDRTETACSFIQSMTWEGPLEPYASGKFEVLFSVPCKCLK